MSTNREKEEQNVEKINSRAQMASLAQDLGVRVDWHEPDEQGVSARVVGNHLDNAMGSEAGHLNCGEYNVVISKDGQDVAVVNLATLLALASIDNYHGIHA